MKKSGSSKSSHINVDKIRHVEQIEREDSNNNHDDSPLDSPNKSAHACTTT